MTEPGQPCVMISGNAFSCWERTWMKWISDPVDLGGELRKCVELRLGLAPVVVGRPVAGEFLHRRQLHALRSVCDELLAGPARRLDPASQLSELLFGNLDLEWTYVDGGLGGRTHDDLRSGRAARTFAAVRKPQTLLLPAGQSNEWHVRKSRLTLLPS